MVRFHPTGMLTQNTTDVHIRHKHFSQPLAQSFVHSSDFTHPAQNLGDIRAHEMRTHRKTIHAAVRPQRWNVETRLRRNRRLHASRFSTMSFRAPNSWFGQTCVKNANDEKPRPTDSGSEYYAGKRERQRESKIYRWGRCGYVFVCVGLGWS